MKRERLETYLGKRSLVVLHNGDIFSGYLKKSGTSEVESNPNLYLKKNFYFFTETKNDIHCISHLFRCSHVKTAVVLDLEEEDK